MNGPARGSYQALIEDRDQVTLPLEVLEIQKQRPMTEALRTHLSVERKKYRAESHLQNGPGYFVETCLRRMLSGERPPVKFRANIRRLGKGVRDLQNEIQNRGLS